MCPIFPDVAHNIYDAFTNLLIIFILYLQFRYYNDQQYESTGNYIDKDYPA